MHPVATKGRHQKLTCFTVELRSDGRNSLQVATSEVFIVKHIVETRSKSIGLVRGLALSLHSSNEMNRLNYRNDYGHDVSTRNIAVVITVTDIIIPRVAR